MQDGSSDHLVVHNPADLSAMLARVGDRDAVFRLPHRRSDEFHHGGSPDQRDRPSAAGKVRDIYIPDLRLDTIRMKPREFR